jgi:alkylation response protein AidB-like acyl-CoA dehydrogenase
MRTDDLFLRPDKWVDDSAQDFVSAVRKWAEKEILSNRHEYLIGYDNLFDENRKKLIIDIGFERLILSEKHGGYGWNETAKASGILATFSEIGRADATVGFMAAVKAAIFSTITVKPDMESALCDRLCPLYFTDNLKDAALILPGPGTTEEETPLFMGRSVMCRISSGDDCYFITGRALRPVGCGNAAEIYCVVCMNEDEKPCLVFIPGDTKGITKGEPIKNTGLDACRNADISFDDVSIPKQYVVDREGAVLELYSWLSLFLGGVSLGAAINVFEILGEWAESRVIKGGEPMKENALCASVMAYVAEEIATVTLMSYSLSEIMAEPAKSGGMGSRGIYTFSQMIGSRIQQSALNAINRAMELMGSAGYAKEWHVEKHWRDVKTIQSNLCGVGAEIPVKMDIARYFYDCKDI